MNRVCIAAISLLVFFSSCGKKVSKSEEHYLKGNEFIFNDDYINARTEFTDAIEADSTNWRACYQLGGICQMEGKFQDALFYFEKALKLNPKFVLGHFTMSNLEDFMGNEKQSMKDLKRTISLKRDLFMPRLIKARKEYAAGKFNVAIADLDTAIAIRHDFYMVYSMRGSAKYQLKAYEAAIKDFDEEIKYAPSHNMGYVNRAVANGELKNYRAAIQDLSTALQIDPLFTQAYLYRGVFFHKLNIKDSGCGDFRMAYKLKNPQAEAYSKEYCK